ncbi:MAG: hypothetical protein JXL97_07240 [Bacteroidales bacterium]|nr:hypothetical protein [Bacteroidales bacterium]
MKKTKNVLGLNENQVQIITIFAFLPENKVYSYDFLLDLFFVKNKDVLSKN